MNLLSVNDISYSYQTNKPVFTNVTFQVKTGQILTVLGPNGVGKSTLLKCLLGINRVQAGQVMVNGQNIASLHRRQIAQQIAYVPQNYQVSTGLTVWDYLLTARAPYLGPLQTPGEKDQQCVLENLKRFELLALRDKQLSSLSGGQLQLVTIAKALVQQPRLLILDEPMAALDLSRQKEVLTLLKSLAATGIAIVLTTHLPDHVFLLNSSVGLFFPNGQLKVGSIDQLMSKGNLTAIYHTPLELTYLPHLHRYTCQLLL